MADSPSVIFSDSDALIGDIEFVFRDRHDFVSSESIGWVRRYLLSHNVKLVIADMDMKIADQTAVLNQLRDLGEHEPALLILVSESKKFKLEREFDMLGDFEHSVDWLIKPFSKNSLISTVGHLTAAAG